MRILYLSLSYVPSRRASAVQVMRMCAAMAHQGHRVTLVSKRNRARQEAGVKDVFAFYGVEPTFELLPVARPSLKGGGLVYLQGMRRLLAERRPELVYSRDLAGAWLAARAGLPLLFEAHAPPAGPLGRALMRRVAGAASLRRVVFISAALERLFAEDRLLPAAQKTMVAHDAAAPTPEPAAARRNGAALAAGYVGNLYRGRGGERLLELAGRLPEVEFHLVGPEPEDLTRRRGAPANLRFHGFVPPAEVAAWCQRFDILLLPYGRRVAGAGGRTDIAAFMSPMKLFEYMAAGAAIVASDLPVLREVLTDGSNALLVEPGDVDALETAMRRLIDDPELRRRLGSAARDDLVRKHTWEIRARQVLDGL